ncbi:hypothetical protein [Pontibacter sp. G13]|uniref:hypothetical protein n=1 Tax=Pontibacter sp. G13 TaxID=3074898 RepID=UPI00288ADD3F|nr:hypothetical protein [Pontibacter sp. G13]WNJ17050.1 hypothetical protein RJD25_19520 [Pontibacter sp. G13]
MSAKEYGLFEKEIYHYFDRRGLEIEIVDGSISVKSEDFGDVVVGLSNLAQFCKQNKRRDYRTIIFQHFDAWIESAQQEQAFNQRARDFEYAKQYLAVRIYPEAHLSQVGEGVLISEWVAGDLYKLLVFDLPQAIKSVHADQAAQWGISHEELMKIGMSNAQKQYPQVLAMQSYGEHKIWFAQGEHFFSPNIILHMEQHPDLIGSKGTIVGVPTRQTVLMYPMESESAKDLISLLAETVLEMYQEGPGSISHQLFWYYQGIFRPLPYGIQDDQVKMVASNALVEMLMTIDGNW